MEHIRDKYGVFWYNEQEICHWEQEDFDKKAAEFAEAGVNIVMTFSSTHFRWSFYPWLDQIHAAIAKIVKACHKYGIRVVEHHSCHLTHNPRSTAEWERLASTFRVRKSTFNMFPGLKEHIAWGDPEIAPGVRLSTCRQIDGRTADFGRTFYTGYAHCYNNPHFRKAYFKILEDVYATGVDGIMTDDVQYFGGYRACTCPVCRQKFKEETGYDLPDQDNWGKFFGNLDDPSFIAWRHFRLRSTEAFHRAVNDHFKSLGLNLLRPNYTTTTFARNAGAYPFESAGDLWSCIFQENMFSSVIRTSWPCWHSIAEHRRSMAEKNGVCSMSMFYPARQDDYYFSWSLSKAWNQLLMATPEGGDLNEVEKKFAEYDREHPVLLQADNRPDIGFIQPRSALDFDQNPSKAVICPMNVFLQAGLFNNLSYTILFENDPVERLLKTPVVVLAGGTILGDDLLERLKEYCLRGGKLLVFGPIGLRDTDGSKREHPEKIFGLEVELSEPVPLEAGQFVYEQKAVPLPPSQGRYFKRVSGASLILAQNGGDKITGISAMNGNFIWLTGGVRCSCVQDYFRERQISRWLTGQDDLISDSNVCSYLKEVPGALLKLILGKPQKISCSRPDCLATAYFAADGKSAEIHLVNTAGTLPEKGESFGHNDLLSSFLPGAGKNQEAFELSLSLAADVKQAEAFSPEFQDARPISFTRSGSELKLFVPAGTFAGYLQIKLSL